MSPENIKALRDLRDTCEHVVDGVVWLKCELFQEFKVSPYGLEGDFDRDAYWVSFEDIYEGTPSVLG